MQIWIFKFWNTGNRHYWEEQSFVITLDQEKENRRMVEFEYRKLQIQLIAKERVFSNCSYLAHI